MNIATRVMGNADLAERRNRAVARGVAHATSGYAVRAENAEVWDADGRHLIDFAGGIGVLNTGHRHPDVVAAAKRQIDLFTHTAFQVMPYEAYVSVAERLNALSPITGPLKTVLFTTGAEAVENAVKVARAATGRSTVIAFDGSFHGRTVYASALTGKVNPYKKGFGPAAAGVFHLPFPIEHYGVTTEDTLRALDRIFRCDSSPEDVAAIIVEPVLGEGGYYAAPIDLLQALRQICDQHGILFIADEVQAGCARTGRMFAIEHSGVQPDLIATAKSLGGGFPLSALIGRAEIMDAPAPGGLGGTYAGSPVACAAALAVLDAIEAEGLLQRARSIGARLLERLGQMAERTPSRRVRAVRTLGAMTAFDLFTADGLPDPTTATQLVKAAYAEGLIVLSCGIHGNAIRIIVPLTISEELLDRGADRLGTALDRVMAGDPA